MATYREEIDKIYKRIDSLLSKGDDYYIDYIKYIDSLVESGQYGIMGDVFYFKYGIDFSVYRNLQDLKSDTFKKIKIKSTNNFQKNFQKILDQKNVYAIGTHFFDKTTNKYLGDIFEYDTTKLSPNLSMDTDLYARLYESKNYFVLAKISDEESLKEAIPPFNSDLSFGIKYNQGVLVRYENSYYECLSSYTWSINNKITPTFSTYWDEVTPVSQTQSLFTNPKDKLLEKYGKAIDFINNDNFT
jgi:hypothetical protein